MSRTRPADSAGIDAFVAQRKQAVERGLRIAVRFEGEANPTFGVAERLAEHNVPGLSFAVIRNGQVDWTEGYGVIERGQPTPVTATTLFQAGSISKPVTVAAAMRMREAKLIDFDANVQNYLGHYVIPPGKQTAANPVTFRNLLGHFAGVVPGGYRGYQKGDPLPSDVDILNGAPPSNTAKIRVTTAPGERLAYSGAGYTIAEVAMQQVTGKGFADLMREWVLAPLQLDDSTFAQPHPHALHARTARGHDSDGTVVPGGWAVHPEQAAAGLWSTSADLARFMVEIYRARHGRSQFLSHSAAIEMLTEQRDQHAYGYRLAGDGFSFHITHYGGTTGFRACVILYPATGNGAAFLTNSDAGMSLGTEMVRAVAAVYGWPEHQQVSVRRVEAAPETLARLTGSYRFPSGLIASIVAADGGAAISVTFPNGDLYPLVATGALSFIYPTDGITVEFEGLPGQETLLLYGQTGTRE